MQCRSWNWRPARTPSKQNEKPPSILLVLDPVLLCRIDYEDEVELKDETFGSWRAVAPLSLSSSGAEGRGEEAFCHLAHGKQAAS
jgi:hypothetical protein